MTLSIASAEVPDAEVPQASLAPLLSLDFEVPLPPALRRFGHSTRAKLTGRRGAPLVVVLGGISGNRFVAECADGRPGWWQGLVGEDCTIDPRRFRILGLDFAADESGRAAPTTLEQAHVLRAALDEICVEQAAAIVGASYGGMVALAFAEAFPARVGKLVIVSACAEPHSSATAARELQRRIVGLGLQTGARDEALAIARGLAMLTYRTLEEFADRFPGGITCEEPLCPSAPGEYLRARGEAFCAVMSPERFLSLSASIDRHRVDPARIAAPTLLIGADNDQLVPAVQLRSLAERLGSPAELHLLSSLFGHDMFLKEAEKIGALTGPFLSASR